MNIEEKDWSSMCHAVFFIRASYSGLVFRIASIVTSDLQKGHAV